MVTKRGVAITYVSEEAREYKQTVAEICDGLTPFLSDVFITYRIFRPRRSGDLSNRIKILEDAMEGTVYLNDKQISEYHVTRFEDKLRPRVELEVTALGLC